MGMRRTRGNKPQMKPNQSFFAWVALEGGTGAGGIGAPCTMVAKRI